jgi:hypothetical protein
MRALSWRQRSSSLEEALQRRSAIAASAAKMTNKLNSLPAPASAETTYARNNKNKMTKLTMLRSSVRLGEGSSRTL